MAKIENALYAWVGADEDHTDLKSVRVSMASEDVTPLVSFHPNQLTQDFYLQQLEVQAKSGGSKIRLCRFVFDGVVQETEAGS